MKNIHQHSLLIDPNRKQPLTGYKYRHLLHLLILIGNIAQVADICRIHSVEIYFNCKCYIYVIFICRILYTARKNIENPS